MECIECDNTSDCSFITDILQCEDCDGEVRIEYNLCRECGTVWKSMNDKPINGMKFVGGSELGQMAAEVLDRFLEMSFKALVESDDVEVTQVKSVDDAVAMSGMVRKCLRCQSYSYPVSKDKYKCSECDFEWEIVESD